jgi:long-chain fatty acid transport protein
VRYFWSLLTCGIYLSAQAAGAAGFGLNEHSADAMASAYAGSAATGSDASYLAYNPASLADVEGFDASLSAVAIFPPSNADYTVANTSAATPISGTRTPSSFVASAAVPEIALRQAVDDRWAVGLVISAPWGLTTNYPTTWAGRYYAEKTRLLTINATPTVSYKISPRLAVGAGLQIEYAEGTLTSAVDIGTLGATFSVPGSDPGAQDGQATFRAKSWALGFTIGVTAQVTNDLRVGLSYRSSIHHVLSGPLSFTLDSAGIGAALQGATGLFTNTTAKTIVNTPDVVRLGAVYALSDRWNLLAETDWTNWHRFHNLNVVAANPAQPPDLTNARWGDSWFGSFGVDYKADDNWRMRAGAGYDSTPIPQATLNPRIPDANRMWISVGAKYRVNDKTAVNLTLARLFNSDGTISQNPAQPGNALRGTLIGTSSSDVNVVGFEVSYRTH